jgi:serine/threonine protein kinase
MLCSFVIYVSIVRWDEPLLRLATDVARGIEYLHSCRYFDETYGDFKECILHRDLKPDNGTHTQTQFCLFWTHNVSCLHFSSYFGSHPPFLFTYYPPFIHSFIYIQVLVSDFLRGKLTDFGTSRAKAAEESAAMSAVGTPLYCAPEVMLQAEVILIWLLHYIFIVI